MPVDKVQKLINAIDNNKTGFTTIPFISEKLRKLVEIPESEKKLADRLEQQAEDMSDKFKQLNNGLEQTKNELKLQLDSGLEQTKNELKQQIKDMQELLLNSFIKNSNTKNGD